ncbi:MAG: TauD/TfdA family dioxygenase [Gammaproteobacteria bacterium]
MAFAVHQTTWCTPGFVGFFCLQQPVNGGLGKVVDLAAAHRFMAAQHPELLDRLYQPFCWDRQAEHGEDSIPVSRHPVFEQHDGSLVTRYCENHIAVGHELAGQPIEALGRAALATLKQVLNEQCTSVHLRLRPGQFQYVNNHRLAHARAPFERDGRAASTRPVLRIWNRFEGDGTLEGDVTLMS